MDHLWPQASLFPCMGLSCPICAMQSLALTKDWKPMAHRLDLVHRCASSRLHITFLSREPPCKSLYQKSRFLSSFQNKVVTLAPTFPPSQRWLELRSRHVIYMHWVLFSSPQSSPLLTTCPTLEPTKNGHLSLCLHCWLVFFLSTDKICLCDHNAIKVRKKNLDEESTTF